MVNWSSLNDFQIVWLVVLQWLRQCYANNSYDGKVANNLYPTKLPTSQQHLSPDTSQDICQTNSHKFDKSDNNYHHRQPSSGRLKQGMDYSVGSGGVTPGRPHTYTDKYSILFVITHLFSHIHITYYSTIYFDVRLRYTKPSLD